MNNFSAEKWINNWTINKEENNMNNIYNDAFISLTNILNVYGIKYNVSRLHGGWQIRFDSKRDVVCHSFSYGNEQGPWESYGFDADHGDVTGFLTPEDVVIRVLHEVEKVSERYHDISNLLYNIVEKEDM